MRRTEERLLMILSVMGVLLIVSTFAIQYFDSQIQDYNAKVIVKQGRENNDALLLIHYVQTYYQYSLYEALGTNITFFNDTINQYRPGDIQKIISDYKNGNITNAEAIKRLKDEMYPSIENKATEYETHYFELQNMTSGNWNLYKNLASGFQMILIIGSVLGYVRLYYNIKTREQESNEEKPRRKHR